MSPRVELHRCDPYRAWLTLAACRLNRTRSRAAEDATRKRRRRPGAAVEAIVDNRVLAPCRGCPGVAALAAAAGAPPRLVGGRPVEVATRPPQEARAAPQEAPLPVRAGGGPPGRARWRSSLRP